MSSNRAEGARGERGDALRRWVSRRERAKLVLLRRPWRWQARLVDEAVAQAIEHIESTPEGYATVSSMTVTIPRTDAAPALWGPFGFTGIPDVDLDVESLRRIRKAIFRLLVEDAESRGRIPPTAVRIQVERGAWVQPPDGRLRDRARIHLRRWLTLDLTVRVGHDGVDGERTASLFGEEVVATASAAGAPLRSPFAMGVPQNQPVAIVEVDELTPICRIPASRVLPAAGGLPRAAPLRSAMVEFELTGRGIVARGLGVTATSSRAEIDIVEGTRLTFSDPETRDRTYQVLNLRLREV